MAKNLIKAGHDLAVWNHTAGRNGRWWKPEPGRWRDPPTLRMVPRPSSSCSPTPGPSGRSCSKRGCRRGVARGGGGAGGVPSRPRDDGRKILPRSFGFGDPDEAGRGRRGCQPRHACGEPRARRNVRPDARPQGTDAAPGHRPGLPDLHRRRLREHGEKDISAVSEAGRR